MKTNTRLVMVMLTTLSMVTAAPAADFEMTWHTIDGGGGTSVAGPFTLQGTVGQPDAGVVANGAFELRGGFWSSALDVLVPGDCDHDGDIDLDDQECFVACLLGPNEPATPACNPWDFDGDNDIDLADWADFVRIFQSQ
ncbi:MAG TPA: hypothetical protein PKN33_07870 [Phycisphaerae bacterium]|nr:hypothetical protein [Phycisphaerae bacterium]